MKTENISAVSVTAIKITGLGKWCCICTVQLAYIDDQQQYDLSTNKLFLHISYTDDDYDDVQMNRSTVRLVVDWPL